MIDADLDRGTCARLQKSRQPTRLLPFPASSPNHIYYTITVTTHLNFTSRQPIISYTNAVRVAITTTFPSQPASLMAYPHVSEGMPGTPSNIYSSQNMSPTHINTGAEDSDEWEYEYSTTETDVRPLLLYYYYDADAQTLDLLPHSRSHHPLHNSQARRPSRRPRRVQE